MVSIISHLKPPPQQSMEEGKSQEIGHKCNGKLVRLFTRLMLSSESSNLELKALQKLI